MCGWVASQWDCDFYIVGLLCEANGGIIMSTAEDKEIAGDKETNWGGKGVRWNSVSPRQ